MIFKTSNQLTTVKSTSVYVYITPQTSTSRDTIENLHQIALKL